MKIEKLMVRELFEKKEMYGKIIDCCHHLEAPNNFELQNKINELIEAFNTINTETVLEPVALMIPPDVKYVLINGKIKRIEDVIE